jgi:hypothetical protein
MSSLKVGTPTTKPKPPLRCTVPRTSSKSRTPPHPVPHRAHLLAYRSWVGLPQLSQKGDCLLLRFPDLQLLVSTGQQAESACIHLVPREARSSPLSGAYNPVPSLSQQAQLCRRRGGKMHRSLKQVSAQAKGCGKASRRTHQVSGRVAGACAALGARPRSALYLLICEPCTTNTPFVNY